MCIVPTNEAENYQCNKFKMMLEEIHTIFQSNAELFSIAGFLAGTLVGNYFSIEQDRRKEFNEIVTPIYFKMKSQIEAGLHYIEDFNADVIEHHLPWYKKRSFRYHAEKYRQSRNGVSEYQPSTSEVTIDEAAKSKMLECASKVLFYLKPR